MIKCFEASRVQRIEDTSNDVSRVYVYDNANEHINTAMARRGTRSRKREETILRKDGSSAVINIALEKGRGKKGKKKILLHGGFEFGHPSKN